MLRSVVLLLSACFSCRNSNATGKLMFLSFPITALNLFIVLILDYYWEERVDFHTPTPHTHILFSIFSILTVVSLESSLFTAHIKSIHISSAFHCLFTGMDFVFTYVSREICCMFSLYKPFLPDCSSKKNEFYFNYLSQEAWSLINSFLISLCYRNISFTPYFWRYFLFKQLLHWKADEKNFGSK